MNSVTLLLEPMLSLSAHNCLYMCANENFYIREYAQYTYFWFHDVARLVCYR